MRIIELDVSGCTTPLDFLDALSRAIGSPHLLSSPDAFVDSMIWGGMGSVKPPYTVRVVGTSKVNSEVKKEIEILAQVIKDARLWRYNHRHDDVEVTVEITP